MAPKDDNNAGIKTGDQVLVWLQSYGRDRPEHQGLRFATVERTTRTQVVIEGIRYHSDPYHKDLGEPVKVEDREWIEVGEDSGRRRFAHLNTTKPLTWRHLLAEKDHPEALKRAQAINERIYDVFGYQHYMYLPQILNLAENVPQMDSLERVVEQTVKAREQILEQGRQFVTENTPPRED